MLIQADVTETWYGLGERRRDGRLNFIVWLDPMLRGVNAPRFPKWKLVLDVELPVYGVMLITTHRLMMVSESYYLRSGRLRAGIPQWASRLTFDPKPEGDTTVGPNWRGDLHGHWDVRRVKIARRTAWERLRG